LLLNTSSTANAPIQAREGIRQVGRRRRFELAGVQDEYKRKGNIIATEEQLAQIAKHPKLEFMRRGINQHTLENICNKQLVRITKLAQLLQVLEQYTAGTRKDGCSPDGPSILPSER
jgi:hypothetical protein